LTRLGAGALVIGIVCFVAGLALAWPGLALVGTGLVVAVVLAFAYAVRQPQVRIRREIQPARVAKGLPAIAFLEMTNTGRTSAGRTVAIQPFNELRVRTVLPRLERGQSGMRTYRLPTSRRGIFHIGPLEVARSDPFELVRFTRRHGGNDQIWVYPRIIPLRSLPSGPTRHLEGPTSDTSPHGNITFHRLREYVAGDDIRSIHWKSTARTGKLMVRHNVDTSQPYTVVLLDVRPESYSAESFETAMDVAASVVTCAARGKSPVQLRVTAPRSDAARGEGQRVGGPREHDPRAIVDFLTGIEPVAAGSLGAELLRLRGDRGGTALVVVTGVAAEHDIAEAAALRRRFERVVVVSVGSGAPEMQQFPGVRVINATDGDDFARAWNLEAAR
jgi:uncharacterized protein (DUF58 family)